VHYRNNLMDYTPKLRDVCRRAPCVILALPSLAQMDAEQLKRFGVHACLSKPISATRLLPLLQDSSLFQSSLLSENTLPVEDQTAHTLRLPLSVMAVDDNPANLKLIGALLEEQVEQIILCENGADAIEQAKRQKIDIILMDIQMPEMDGIRTSELIRQLPNHIETPIVAVTAHTLDDDREHLLQAGMDDYLAK
ncbi:two-component sensor histidine kinase BarA, partial [Escherichia coli]